MTVLPDTGYTPTADDLASVEKWFADYDAASGRRDIERMADMAVFPLNLVSDDSAGCGASAQWDRQQYIETMIQVLGDGEEDISFESTRTPVFLSPAMVIVFSDSTMTMEGHTQQLRYADVLIRREDGEWAFQSMLQGGWGDRLR
ncbi:MULTISPECIES: nuclear transport factor 2 family protein [Streptomyces]|uniref:Nuclear transport factor 2 family protein n=1 Tax=Streptomyces chengmaiensis TaxID=3040919 RepID=A0ABT6HFA7_9ACTN|nr:MULTISPECIES: nuclear transport factor 2 family protein [Streptomyces]MDH2387448.1 nuclear transport factor 2 family protein [Streptomyces chengmaiensis]WRQ81295.1 nuclear transport factor 2 family protein [Streptomyces sp. MUM 178J]